MTTNNPTPVELSDEKQIDRGALCEECEQWENNEDGNPRTFMVCGACWNKLQATNTALREQLAEVQFWKKQAEGWIAGVEEREAATCPEDVGFDEYIRTLESRLAQVEQERELSCWHCGVVLEAAPKLRCEDCPDECDVVNCAAFGCAGVTAQQHLDS